MKRILVAVKDTSARMPPAVVKAAQLADRLGARVHLFHAIDTPIYVDTLVPAGSSVSQIKRELRDHHLQRLEKMAARIRSPSVKVSVEATWDFPIYEAIVRHAQRTGADLIVAERHARRHIAPWLLHVTDWELIRLSPLPLLLVKRPGRYRRPTVLAAVDPSHAYDKPARLDRAILQVGRVVSTALGGTLHALHAYVPVPVGSAETWLVRSLAAEYRATARAQSSAGLKDILRSTSIPGKRSHLVERPPAIAIPETARAIRSDIVVMGAISRSGLKAAFIGNTAESVLDDLSCDLLVVKPPGFANRVPRKVRGARYSALAPLPW